jgi:hypothetical protein
MKLSDFAGLKFYNPSNVPRWEKMQTAPIKALDRLCQDLGLSAFIPILSGYRTEAENRAIGGVERSQHLTGNAVDIPVPTAYRVTVAKIHEFFFKGVGAGFNAFGFYYPEMSAHFDCRPPKASNDTYRWSRIGGKDRPYISYEQGLQMIADKLQDGADVSKKNWVPIILVLTGLAGLIYYLLSRK